MCFFLMSQGSLNPKIRLLGQKVCPVAHSQTHRQTHRVITEGILSGFQDLFLQPIIKVRPNNLLLLLISGRHISNCVILTQKPSMGPVISMVMVSFLTSFLLLKIVLFPGRNSSSSSMFCIEKSENLKVD